MAKPPPLPKPRKPFPFKKVAIRLALLGVIIVAGLAVVSVGLNWKGRRDWAQCRESLEKRGEHLELSSFLPKPVPDDKNIACLSCFHGADNGKGVPNPVNIQRLSGREHLPTGRWQAGIHTDFEQWRNQLRSAKTSTVETRRESAAEEILLVCSNEFGASLNELWLGLQRPEGVYPLEWGRHFHGKMMTDISRVKSMVTSLTPHADVLLAGGRPGEAWKDLLVCYRLINALTNDPFILTMMVRSACYEQTIQPVWEGVSRRQWTESQMTVLEQELAGMDLFAQMIQTLRGERALANAMIDKMIEDPDEYVRMMEDEADGSETGRKKSFKDPILNATWVMLENKVTLNRSVQELIDCMETYSGPANYAVLLGRLESWPEPKVTSSRNALAAASLKTYYKTPARLFRVQTMINLARVACALERHRLAEGKYPDKLDALAPRFFKQVPLDPFSGKAFCYRLEASGDYLLYSVGENRVDNQGKVVFKKDKVVDPSRGDWVWFCK